MNILIVHEIYGLMAGAEQNIYLTAQELKARGHRIGIIYSRKSAKTEPFDAVMTWQHELEFSTSNPHVIDQALAHARTQFQPDLIYVHKLTNVMLLDALFSQHIPVVRMIHDHDTYCMRSYRYSPFTRRICRRKIGLYCLFGCLAFLKRNRERLFQMEWVSYSKKRQEVERIRRYDAIFVNSSYMQAECVQHGAEKDRVSVFPPVPKSQSTQLSASFSDENIILYLGQIIRGKGVDILIKALAQVSSSFKTICIGSGSHVQVCMELAEQLGLNDRVQFVGWVDPEKLTQYFQNASVVVVPSMWPEPFGQVGPEAMRFGLPVVGFDSGGISDWLIDGQNGYLIPWNNICAFARSIDRLLSDKTLARQMGEWGRGFVNKHYDFDAYITRMEHYFAGLINAGSIPQS